MCRKPQKIRVHKISICAGARYALRKNHVEEICMFVINRKSFFESFARFLCHDLCLHGNCIFRSNEAQFACPKKQKQNSEKNT